ncbi:DUF3954 domain-containing protein [Bacillus mycoides]
MKVEIGVACNAILIVEHGRVKRISPPITGCGEQVTVWVGK